jgi:tellurite methyltransferase
MTTDDASRWNERYQQRAKDNFCQPRAFLTENIHLLSKTGIALDLATGLGDNAAALMAHGLRVMGVDISKIAVQRAKRRFPKIMAVMADLDHPPFSNFRFDVITNFYYLNREMLASLRNILKPGGIIVIETLTVEMLHRFPDLPRSYLLSPGELAEYFKNWEILRYREGWIETDEQHPKAVASIIAREKDEREL